MPAPDVEYHVRINPLSGKKQWRDHSHWPDISDAVREAQALRARGLSRQEIKVVKVTMLEIEGW
jgi:hypothetical protein